MGDGDAILMDKLTSGGEAMRALGTRQPGSNSWGQRRNR